MDDNKVLIDEQNLYDIADAIRRKNGETVKYLPDEMPPAIDAIPTGSGASLAGNLAVAYESLTFPVVIGTHCIYNDMYYVSVEPIDSSEPFTPSHWRRITAGVEIESLTNYVHDMSPVANVSPAPVVYVSDAAPLDAEGLVVYIEPVQEGNGDPSPDNVRPITGWTGAKVTRCGKNLLPYLEQGAYLVSNGQPAVSTNTIRSPKFYLPAGSYTFTVSNASSVTMLTWLLDGTYETNKAKYTPNLTFDLLEDRIVGFNLYKSGGLTPSDEPTVQMELGSTATEYEPYVGYTYDITFPSEAGTVYGGTLDVVKGELVVDRAQIASYNGETLPGEWISDRDVYAAGASPTTGAQVVYELATPITYQLTPQEVALLRGSNTIFADTGNSTLTYRQDVSILLQTLTASISKISP